MRKYSVHARWLLTYSVSGTSLSGGKTEFLGMAASGGDNGAPFGGVAGPASIPWGASCAIKGDALRYSHILYVTI